MPGPKKRSTHAARRDAAAAPAPRSRKIRALLVVDNRPLQREAWAEFHTAQKRFEKAGRDLHRHEEIDRPAYNAWIHRTFPVWVTTLRELYNEVSLKKRQVQTVIALAELTGRSLKKLWREQKDYDANPDAFDETEFDEPDNSADPDPAERDDTSSSSGGNTDRQRRREHDREFAFERATPPPSSTARDLYRRLVQHLHPDRGGDWNAARQRLWHEVQQAWAAGDADWLARLEAEWESANEVLGPTSPVSRLRRAIAEFIAARRDIERKLREYRRSQEWRFTLSGKKRHILHARTYANFRHDVYVLQEQLNHLNRTIAAWEKDDARAAARPRRKSG
jgi:hypothetical protein